MGQVESRVAVNRCGATMTTFSDGCSSFRGPGRFVTAFRRIELARDRVPDDGIQPVRDIHSTARVLGSRDCTKCWSNTDQTAERCQDCQHRERHPHRRRRLVRNVRAVMVAETVTCDVMRHGFVYWPNVLAGFV